MSEYVIMTDSSCDLPAQLADRLGLVVAPLTVVIDGREYRNLLDGSEISFEDIYSRLRGGEVATTAAVNIDGFTSLMRPILESGRDILYLGFSSALSSTYSAGAAACEALRAEFPERTLLHVDTLSASMGQGLLVWLTCKKRDEGATIEQARDYAEQTKLNVCHRFTVDDLHFLHRGGRVSKTVAVVGSMLSIKPVMHTDNEGRLTLVGKVRGRRASLDSLVDSMRKTATDPKAQTVFIVHGDCLDDAKYVAGRVREELGVKDIVINYVGPVIGSHSGPGTVALFFVGTER